MPKKLLPKPSKLLSLSKSGYNIHKNKKTRHSSLRKASKKYNPLAVLRHINLIRNLQSGNKKVHKKMSSDVDYMKGFYKKSKKI